MRHPQIPPALDLGMRRHALTQAQQAPLWREYRLRPTPELRERLALANLRLVAAVAGHWKGPADPDAMQDGFIGLMTAVEKFDPKRGNTFATHAVWWIRAAINRRTVSPTSGPYVSVVSSARGSTATRAAGYLEAHLGRPPSTEEVSDWLGWSVEKTEQGLGAARASRRPASLDRHLGEHEEGSRLVDFLVSAGDPEQDLERAEAAREALLRVRDAVARLPKRRERHLFAAYCLSEEEPSLTTLSRRYGVTRQAISQVIVRARRRVLASLHGPPRHLGPVRRRLLLTRWAAIISLEGPDPLPTPQAA